MVLSGWIQLGWCGRVRPRVAKKAYDVIIYVHTNRWDGSTIVEKACLLDVPAVYVAMNYR